MDEFNGENPKHVYKIHDGNAFEIDLATLNNSSNNNNNNNEKMDDANKTATTTADATKKLTNTVHCESMDNDSMADELKSNELCVPQNEVHADDLQNDNQSNGSDSTDNISFVSDDSNQQLNFSDHLLNHFSDDESNSDDIVYAYRGGDFGVPANDEVNADDETDYLEMDFEPDPASEIEQEQPNRRNELPNQSAAVAAATAAAVASPNRMFDASSNPHGDDFKVPLDNARTNAIRQENNFSKNPNSNTDSRLKQNWQSNKQNHEKSLENMENKLVKNESAQQQYYDKTVSLSTTKYTGTIPKTSRSNSRAIKMKPTTINGQPYEPQPSCSHHVERNGVIYSSWTANKRWKITDEPSTSAYTSNTGFVNSHPVSTMRSMSFPCEELSNQRNKNESNSKKSKITNDNGRCRPLTLSNNEIFCGANDNGEMNSHDDSSSVTFCSSYCSLDTIVNALKSINVLPNSTILQEALNDDESEVPSMNIPEYLIHVSKRNCNYKAIMLAIERSCSNVHVQFFQASNELTEMVHIPVQTILSKLPHNGSLRNVLTIKNKRFHQMNVLGKIVNVIRKFADMRNDVNHNEFIAIPQFYRTGFICIKKLEPISKHK